MLKTPRPNTAIKSAIVGCRVVFTIYVCIERVRVGLMDYGGLVMSLERNGSRLGAAMIMEGMQRGQDGRRIVTLRKQFSAIVLAEHFVSRYVWII